MTFDRLTRWQAAPIHLAISVTIAAVVLGAMLSLWYPRPYFLAAGGATLALLLVGVDVIIGPLLTLIVFDQKKKHLVFDLAVIAMLQSAALTYGVSIMFHARPVFVTFAVDRFHLVAANEISQWDLDQAGPHYRALSLTGPQMVGAMWPAAGAERDRMGLAVMLGGGMGLFPQHFVPYATVAGNALAQSQPLSELRQKYPGHAADIDAIVARSRGPDTALRYLPLQARHGAMAAVVDTTRGDVKGVVAVDPW